MKSEDFELISGLLKQRSGLILPKDKVYLLESRLTPIAHRRGLDSLDELVSEVRLKRKEDLLSEITEAMTTNESFFFRDNKPFDLFKDSVLPQLLESRASRKKIRIWCAAASTGQEPYSLAIILKELSVKLAGWNIEIVGTDLSQKVLDKAKMGLFSQFEVQRGLPIQMLIKYFNQVGELWQISEEIRNMVSFRKFNLLDPYTLLGSFDVIFCRNVLIYFDQPTKTEVLEKMRKLLPNDGTLFLGAAETVLGITDKFKPVQGQRGLYSTADASIEVIEKLRAV
ncbi:MAG: protein-glutamate O-methyltransferase [Alphaproteobacteria bacterium]|nr:protein-glutamate O-methyltransferase [Alphaproteobacteria bacterium]HPF46013.1 protein-glutamate O-methyltransferase [Emcibacteraceae bacterium]HRW28824.1 protein-glutamate O-methyltransferase [Emcibacteraceae bacterium]